MLYNQLGYFIAYKCFQYKAKEEMKERMLQNLPDSALETISHDDNISEIEWEEENKEFFFRGEMYDVVRIHIVNGKKFYVCFRDTGENRILKEMNAATKSKQSGKHFHSPTAQQLYDFPAAGEFDLSFSPRNIHHDYPHFSMRIFNRSIDAKGPPPRTC